MSRTHFLKLRTGVSVLVPLLLLGCATKREEPPSPVPKVRESEESVAEEALPEKDLSPAEILAALYAEGGNDAEALAVLDKMELGGMDADLQLVYAVLLRSEGRLDESRDILAALVEANPSMASAWFNLALVEHAAENNAARDEALDAAIAADATMAEAIALRGELAVSEENWSRAEESYAKALKLDAESVESLTGLAWVMAKTEREEGALSLLDKAVSLEPDNIYTRVDRSRVNAALGNYGDAEEDLDAAIAREPEVSWHYLDRARIRLRHFRDLDGARADLENVERLDPGNFFAMVYLAGLHEEERRFSMSHEYYRKSVELRPNYTWAFGPLGKYAWMSGDYEEAALWFAKAAEQAPEEFSFELMTALSLLKAGKTRRANAMLAETLKRFERGDTEYEVVRFCVERGSDYYAAAALNKEKDETLRERLWFYLGAIYEIEGNELGARAVFERIAIRPAQMEFDLAWAALHGYGGGS